MNNKQLRKGMLICFIGEILDIRGNDIECKIGQKYFTTSAEELLKVSYQGDNYSLSENGYTLSFTDAVQYLKNNPAKSIERRLPNNKGILRLRVNKEDDFFEERITINDSLAHWGTRICTMEDFESRWRIV